MSVIWLIVFSLVMAQFWMVHKFSQVIEGGVAGHFMSQDALKSELCFGTPYAVIYCLPTPFFSLSHPLCQAAYATPEI